MPTCIEVLHYVACYHYLCIMVSRQKCHKCFPHFYPLSCLLLFKNNNNKTSNQKKPKKILEKPKPKQTKEHHKFSIEKNLAYKLKWHCKEVQLSNPTEFLLSKPDTLPRNQDLEAEALRASSQSKLLNSCPLCCTILKCFLPFSLFFTMENLFYQKDFKSHLIQLNSAKM